MAVGQHSTLLFTQPTRARKEWLAAKKAPSLCCRKNAVEAPISYFREAACQQKNRYTTVSRGIFFCRPPCQRLWKDEFKQCCVANKNIKFKFRPTRPNIWHIYEMQYQERNPRNRMFQKVKKSEEEIEDGSVTGCGCQEFLIRLLLSNWTVTHNTSIYFCKNHKTNAWGCVLKGWMYAAITECDWMADYDPISQIIARTTLDIQNKRCKSCWYMYKLIIYCLPPQIFECVTTCMFSVCGFPPPGESWPCLPPVLKSFQSQGLVQARNVPIFVWTDFSKNWWIMASMCSFRGRWRS